MRRYNLIVVYDRNEQKLLMCKRTKEPYKDMLNFVGGKIESGETDKEAAYRELFEETGISSDDIILTHIMNFIYHLSKNELDVYAGKLKANVSLREEENKLFWIDRSENFCDMTRFAGECNIEHILQQVDYYKDQALR